MLQDKVTTTVTVIMMTGGINFRVLLEPRRADVCGENRAEKQIFLPPADVDCLCPESIRDFCMGTRTSKMNWILKGTVLDTGSARYSVKDLRVVAGSNGGAMLKAGDSEVELGNHKKVTVLMGHPGKRPVEGIQVRNKWTEGILTDFVRLLKESADVSEPPGKRSRTEEPLSQARNPPRLIGVEMVAKYRMDDGKVYDDYRGPVIWNGQQVDFSVVRDLVQLAFNPNTPMVDEHHDGGEIDPYPETLREYLLMIKDCDKAAKKLDNWVNLTPELDVELVDRFMEEAKETDFCFEVDGKWLCNFDKLLAHEGI